MKTKYNFLTIPIAIISIIYWFFNQNLEQPKHTSSKKHNEKYYQTKLCSQLGGKMEYRLRDATRVDCITNKYAIEVDWAKKWAEGIGQALYYSIRTKKRPAVALIVGTKDKKYIKRLEQVAHKLHIKIFLINK
jgi:hypothetical protein